MNYPSHLRRRTVRQYVLMVVSEERAGQVRMVCPNCKYQSPWIFGLTSTEKRRQRCPKCNETPVFGR
jgi:transposase-like protein